MKLIWSFKCLPQLNNKLGFVWLSDAEAASLIASGDVQFPGIGGRRLHYMQRCTGTTPPVVTVPKVLSSIIPDNGDGVMITFDRPMHMTASLQDAMNIIIGTATPTNPDHVNISPDKTQIGLMFPHGHFKTGDVVTWSYNDQHPTEELKGAEVGGLEIDNQTYAIVNNSTATGGGNPPSDTPITGLQSGTTEVIAKANSATLNAALSAGGTLKLRIPKNTGASPIDFDGRTMTDYWVTWDTVQVLEDTTLTFEGGIMQSKDTPKDQQAGNVTATLNVNGKDVILNNPLISQGGFLRTARPGTHSTLTVYGSTNTGNITVNGGIIEGGGSNNFQGGRNNTKFIGTTLRNAREHIIYASGKKGDGQAGNDGTPQHFATGLIFDNCTIANPCVHFETGQYPGDKHEANHIQIRQFKDVTIKNCTVSGVPVAPDGQFAILLTDIHGIEVQDTHFTGAKGGFTFVGNEVDTSKNVKFTRCTNKGSKLNYVCKSIIATAVEFDHCTFHDPINMLGKMVFNDTTFVLGKYRMETMNGADVTFNNTTWDMKLGTTTIVLDDSKGAVHYTGTTTRICPVPPRNVTWNNIPGTCP